MVTASRGEEKGRIEEERETDLPLTESEVGVEGKPELCMFTPEKRPKE